jgi:hypothetical protein
MLFKVVKDQSLIEIKQELKRFEDNFYEFQFIRFKGLPIFVSSFIPYAIPGDGTKFLLCIKPEATLLNRKVMPQYFVYVDCKEAIGFELVMEEHVVFNQIYFYNQNCFIGQRNISPTVQEISTYQITKTIG